MTEKIDDFRFVHVTSSYSQNAAGQLVSQANFKPETESAAIGAVWSTLTFIHNYETPDAESGEVSFAGEAFHADGTKVIGFQKGTWEKEGVNIWKIEMTGKDSREGDVKSVSRMNLETLVLEGSVFRL